MLTCLAVFNSYPCRAGNGSATAGSQELSSLFVKIPPGTFIMGSPVGEPHRDVFGDDETQHVVTISKEFEMQATPVTQDQWYLIMGYNYSYCRKIEFCKNEHLDINGVQICHNYPVEMISWDDAKNFIEKLNQKQKEVLIKTIQNLVLTIQISGVEKGQLEKEMVMKLAMFAFNLNAENYLTTSERQECIPVLIDTVYQSEKKKNSKRIK